MSTEDQQYSIAIQEAAIQTYAESHGYVVASTYVDAGRSGVAIKHRKDLRRLLHDVMSGQAQYKAILVYYVSHWGRFPDADEAAHYEFLCKSAGIAVRYCAEQFDNDGTLPSSMVKALKRTMAAEYSRELAEWRTRGAAASRSVLLHAKHTAPRFGFHEHGTRSRTARPVSGPRPGRSLLPHTRGAKAGREFAEDPAARQPWRRTADGNCESSQARFTLPFERWLRER